MHRGSAKEGVCMRTFFIVAVLIFLVSIVSDTGLCQGEDMGGGFFYTGKTYPLIEDETPRFGILAGRASLFSSSKEIRDFLFYNDTLWIATDGGLFAYSTVKDTIVEVDGKFNNSISAVAVDDEGRLLIGDEGGLSVRGSRWLRYSSESNKFFSMLRDIVCDEGRIWVATYGNGVGVIENDFLRVYSIEDSLLDNRVNRVLIDSPVSVYFGTESGLCYADTLHWESYRYGKKIPIGAVRDMTIDESGNLFLAISGHGVTLYNLMRIKRFGVEDGLPSLEINALTLDSDGTLWAGGKGGVCYFDGSGWVRYELSNYSFSQYNVRALEHGIDGTLFIGTDTGKVIVVSRNRIQEMEIPEKFPVKRVSVVRVTGGTIWFVGGGNVYYIKAGVLRALQLPDRLFYGAVLDVLPLKGEREIWLATRFGILHFNYGLWHVFDRRQGLPAGFYTSVDADSSGSIWFCGYDGSLLEFRGDKWIYHTEAEFAKHVVDRIIVDGNGRVWVALEGGRLFVSSGGKWEEISFARELGGEVTGNIPFDTTLFSMKNVHLVESNIDFGFRRRMVFGLDYDGNLLVATTDGIYRYFAGGWQSIELHQEFKSIEPTAIYASSSGEIFLGTARSGLLVFSGAGWDKIDTGSCLPDNYILTIAEDIDGSVIIGTQGGGLIRVLPQ